MAIGADGRIGNVQKRLDVLVALAHLAKDEIGLLAQFFLLAQIIVNRVLVFFHLSSIVTQKQPR